MWTVHARVVPTQGDYPKLIDTTTGSSSVYDESSCMWCTCIRREVVLFRRPRHIKNKQAPAPCCNTGAALFSQLQQLSVQHTPLSAMSAPFGQLEEYAEASSNDEACQSLRRAKIAFVRAYAQRSASTWRLHTYSFHGSTDVRGSVGLYCHQYLVDRCPVSPSG